MDCRDCEMYHFYIDFKKLGISLSDMEALKCYVKYIDEKISTIQKEKIKEEKNES